MEHSKNVTTLILSLCFNTKNPEILHKKIHHTQKKFEITKFQLKKVLEKKEIILKCDIEEEKEGKENFKKT